MSKPIPAPQARCTTTDASERLDCQQARLVQSRVGAEYGPERLYYNEGKQQTVTLRQALTLVDATGGVTSVLLPTPTLANCGMNPALADGLVKTVTMAVDGNVPVNVSVGRASQLLLQGDSVTYVWSDGRWVVVGSSNVPGGGGGSVTLGNSLFVSPVTGNDATALPNRLDLQYATITAAMTASSAGDVIYLYPGLYNSEPAGVLNMRSGVNVFEVDTCELFQYEGGGEARPASTTIRATLDINVAMEPYVGILAGLCVESPVASGQTLRISGGMNVTLNCFGCQFAHLIGTAPGSYGMDLNATNGGQVNFRQCNIVTTQNSGGDGILMRIADNLGLVMVETNMTGSWVCTGQNASVVLDYCTVTLFQESELACRFQASYTSVNSAAEDAVLQIYSNNLSASFSTFRGDTEVRGETECFDCKFERFLSLVDLAAPGFSQLYDHCEIQNIDAPGYMGPLTFRNCSIQSDDAFQFSMAQNAGQLTFQNCSIVCNSFLDVRVVQLGASIRFFQCSITVNADAISMILYNGPADATVGVHVLANNSFFSAFNTPWIASINPLNITSGGNAVSNNTAANVTLTAMVVL